MKKYIFFLFFMTGVVYGQHNDTIIFHFPKDTSRIIGYHIAVSDTQAIRTGTKSLYLKIYLPEESSRYYITGTPVFFNKNFFRPDFDPGYVDKMLQDYGIRTGEGPFRVSTSAPLVFKLHVLKPLLYMEQISFCIRLYNNASLDKTVKNYCTTVVFFFPEDEY